MFHRLHARFEARSNDFVSDSLLYARTRSDNEKLSVPENPTSDSASINLYLSKHAIYSLVAIRTFECRPTGEPIQRITSWI